MVWIMRMFPIRESAFHCHCRHSPIVYMSTRHFAKFSSQDQSLIHLITIKPVSLAPAFWGEAPAVGFPCILKGSDSHIADPARTPLFGSRLRLQVDKKNPKAGNFTCCGIIFYKTVFKISGEKFFHRLFPLKLSYNMAISPTLPLFHHVAFSHNIFSSSLSVDFCLSPFSISCVHFTWLYVFAGISITNQHLCGLLFVVIIYLRPG